MAAAAAYFAGALRGTGLLPGAPPPAQLQGWTENLASATRDDDVRALADAVRRANELGGAP
ncbi:hypothetical protein [Streptomyces sp. NPDC017940]|uniref:hypothetical protein n=1 Tax=Streptomyces sp. NPDC017940 TaxID=3365017 RepID=UPI0037BA3FA7